MSSYKEIFDVILPHFQNVNILEVEEERYNRFINRLRMPLKMQTRINKIKIFLDRNDRKTD